MERSNHHHAAAAVLSLSLKMMLVGVLLFIQRNLWFKYQKFQPAVAIHMNQSKKVIIIINNVVVFSWRVVKSSCMHLCGNVQDIIVAIAVVGWKSVIDAAAIIIAQHGAFKKVCFHHTRPLLLITSLIK